MNNITVFGIPFFKNGSEIHIKKENKGKFTKYCKGKVTQECIDKAKRSGNPKLVKRAVFAENARGWAKKHQDGGTVDLPEITATLKPEQIELIKKYRQNIPEEIRTKVNKLPYRTVVTKYRDPVERFMEVYDKAGNPKIIMNAPVRKIDRNGNPRAYYNGNVNIPKGSNDVYADVIAELAHPIEYDVFGFKWNRIWQYFKNNYNEFNKDMTHYRDKNNYENRTHNLIENIIYKYIKGAYDNLDEELDVNKSK